MTAKRDHLDALLAEAASLAFGDSPRLPVPGADEPADELLLGYLDASLPPREREAMRQQIARSAYCRERLEVLRAALDEAEQAENAAVSEQHSPVRLCFQSLAGGLRFLHGSLKPESLVAVPVATRGKAPSPKEETAFFDFQHRFEDLDVHIQVESVPGGRMDVQLQCDPPRSQPLRVVLSDRSGALLDSQPVERGSARFASLPPTPHRISITDSRRELGRLLLDVRKD